MAHHRSNLRAAVVQRLKDANTVADDKVFPNRARSLSEKLLPVVLVYTKNEPEVEIFTAAPREYKRVLNLELELVAQASVDQSLDEVLDAFADQVEKAMLNGDTTFGDLCEDVFLGASEIDQVTDGEKPVGVVKITFSLPYYQSFPSDSEGDLDDFAKANIKTDLPEPDETAEAEDSIELPQE